MSHDSSIACFQFFMNFSFNLFSKNCFFVVAKKNAEQLNLLIRTQLTKTLTDHVDEDHQ
ncbi:Uncharacterised protein [Chlamydia trachomatis]|nr:Uncharacterised protein [Chlamydia trachomatis]